MEDKIRKKIKELIKQFNYKITEEQEKDIALLYNIKYQENESTLILLIANGFKSIEEMQDNSSRKNRRPTIYSTNVYVTALDVPKLPKSEETFNFLISKLGNNLIPFALIFEEQKRK